MNRREILKTGLLAPLLGLFKRKTRSGTQKMTEEEIAESFQCFREQNRKSKFAETTGTSGEASWYVWYNENGCRRRSDETFAIFCPVCDCAITKTQTEQMRFDMDCPGCGCRKLSEFGERIKRKPIDPADW